MGAEERSKFHRTQGFSAGVSPDNPTFQVDQSGGFTAVNGNITGALNVTGNQAFTGNLVLTGTLTVAGATTLAGAFSATSTASIPNLLNSTTALGATVTAIAASPAVANSVSGAATSANFVAISLGANASGSHFFGFKTRATGAGGSATTTIVTADVLFSIHACGADGTNYVDSAGLQFISAGTIAAGRVPSQIRMFTGTDVTTTVKTEGLRVDQAQNVSVGNLSGSLLAQGATGGFLHIPACATGKPNGTPGILTTGLVPLVYDAVGNKISVYNGGSWVQTAALT